MVFFEREITEEEFAQVKEDGFGVLIPDSLYMGYGVYNEQIVIKDGKLFLQYSRGDSCD